MFFIHIFTAFPQFLIVNDIDIRAFLSLLLHSPRILLQTLHNKLLINLLLIPKSKKSNLFISQEAINVLAGSLPLLYAFCLKHYSFLAIGNEDLLSKFTFFHVLEESNIADGCV